MLKQLSAGKARQRRLEDQLADTRQAFEHFTYNIAQELHAPLRSIMGASEQLRHHYRGMVNERVLEHVSRIDADSRKLQARIAALMQMARLDRVPQARKKIDADSMIGECLAQLAGEIEARGAEINVQPLPLISGDAQRLKLLFYALISNALIFCDGAPRIVIGARRLPQAWLFSVRDNGIGIAHDRQQAIFQPFARAHGEAYPGIGMGLALAERIARLHGGAIDVASAPGEGSHFMVTLPDRYSSSSSSS